MDIHTLERRRDEKAVKARDILDAAEQREDTSLTAEEEQKFDRLMEEYDELDKRLAREQRLRDKERSREVDDDPPPGDGPGDGDGPMRAFGAWCANGNRGLSDEQVRALQATSDPEGGYLVAPQQFVDQLIQGVDDAVPFRGLATGFTLTEGQSLGAPALDTDLADADWTTEVATGTQDDTLRFGKRELNPHPLAKRVLISRTLLRVASMDPEDIVRERMEYKHATTRENAYMTGDGNEKPLGIFTASDQGISTSQDVNTGAAGGFSGDGLIDIKYALKPQYHRRARWLFHRDSIAEIRKLKDANNQYLWQPGLAGDRPGTILDVPYILSEFVPNTITDGNYVGMLGDFSFYWYVDSLEMEVQRLVELYAETNQVGFISRFEGDGMPVLEEAFIRIKVGA